MFAQSLQNEYYYVIIEEGGNKMIRLFEFKDLDKTMEILLRGNLKVHDFSK